MSKTKSIADLVVDLQRENESLQNLKKLANQFCKKEFGYNMDELHAIVEKQERYERRRAEKAGSAAHIRMRLKEAFDRGEENAPVSLQTG